jgi:predicted RNase H-like HicB family nuclease
MFPYPMNLWYEDCKNDMQHKIDRLLLNDMFHLNVFTEQSVGFIDTLFDLGYIALTTRSISLQTRCMRSVMLVTFIHAAMEHATYEKLETGHYYGEIPVCPGVWSEGKTQEICRKELQEVLEDWLILKLRDGDDLPVVSGIDLNLQKA